MRTRRQSAIGGPTPANIDVEGGGEEEYTPPSGVRAKREVCPYGCQRLVAPRTIEIHRTQGCRGLHEEPFGEADRRRNYLCGVCCMEFHTRRGFMDHMNDEHDVAARIHVLDFPNREMFERFFHWLEVQGGANFRTRSGAKRQLTGKRAMMFRCNRTGYVESQSAAERRNREKLGPVRCGFSCTAYVQVTFHEEGGLLKATTNFGHGTATFGGITMDTMLVYGCHFGVKHLIGRQIRAIVDGERVSTADLQRRERGDVAGSGKHFGMRELLDKAQIDRPGSRKGISRPGDKTTEELARN
ncbi:unnamed protein product, partial [Mesorhabditis belari]|uniref:C2H2-type domain-containing protein n=1 Tax=Mesorhabditis belari TaxID=2138241 RepID=A0AAF3F7D0_9BILA